MLTYNVSGCYKALFDLSGFISTTALFAVTQNHASLPSK